MTLRMTRVTTCLLGGAALVALSACAPQEPGTDTPSPSPKPDALAGVDPCSVIKSEDIAHIGLASQGEPDNVTPSQPSCRYSGEGKDIELVKDASQDVDAYSKQPWDKFDRVTISGRPGASFVPPGSEGTGYCSAMFDAGGGTIILHGTAKSNVTGFDACGETLKLAEKIAPRLPKPE